MILHDDIVSRKLEGEEILLHLKTGTYFGLNTTGTFLFECLKKDAKLSIKNLIEALCAEFEVSPDQAEQDVNEFLRSLQENKLISRKTEA